MSEPPVHHDDCEDALRQKLLTETSKIAWKALQVFFAQGKAVHISSKLDLIDVAVAMSNDDTETISAWMQQGMIAVVSDAQAKLWYDNDVLVWAVVVRPWVLVQNLKQAVEPL